MRPRSSSQPFISSYRSIVIISRKMGFTRAWPRSLANIIWNHVLADARKYGSRKVPHHCILTLRAENMETTGPVCQLYELYCCKPGNIPLLRIMLSMSSDILPFLAGRGATGPEWVRPRELRISASGRPGETTGRAEAAVAKNEKRNEKSCMVNIKLVYVEEMIKWQ